MKTGCFWSKRLYNPCTYNLGPEAQFKISDDESDTKDDRTTNTNFNEGVNYVNGKVFNTDVETVNLPGYDAPQGFVS